jgi:hypothetical protein
MQRVTTYETSIENRQGTRGENVKEPAGKGRKLGRSRDEGADGHIRGKVARASCGRLSRDKVV